MLEKASEKEQTLLLRHYGFGESLRSIAKKERITFQGVASRIKTAVRHTATAPELLRCLGTHWQETRIYGRHFHHQVCRSK